MPLPNTATVQDVIDKLEELQGMNQKAELASVIGSPAVSSDTVAQQILKLQTIKDEMAVAITDKGVATSNTDDLEMMKDNIENISTGGYVTGTVTSSSNQIDFDYYSTGISSSYFVEVSGLSFKPSVISIVGSSVNANGFQTTYYETLGAYSEYALVSTTPIANNANVLNRGYKGNSSNAYVTASGFKLPVREQGTFTYYAYK